MSRGLDNLFERVKADPSPQMVSRYLALLAELPSESEKARRALDLAESLQSSLPAEALALAHMVFDSGRDRLRALDVMIAAMNARGRAGKAEVLKNEKRKIEAEERESARQRERDRPAERSNSANRPFAREPDLDSASDVALQGLVDHVRVDQSVLDGAAVTSSGGGHQQPQKGPATTVQLSDDFLNDSIGPAMRAAGDIPPPQGGLEFMMNLSRDDESRVLEADILADQMANAARAEAVRQPPGQRIEQRRPERETFVAPGNPDAGMFAPGGSGGDGGHGTQVNLVNAVSQVDAGVDIFDLFGKPAPQSAAAVAPASAKSYRPKEVLLLDGEEIVVPAAAAPAPEPSRPAEPVREAVAPAPAPAPAPAAEQVTNARNEERPGSGKGEFRGADVRSDGRSHGDTRSRKDQPGRADARVGTAREYRPKEVRASGRNDGIHASKRLPAGFSVDGDSIATGAALSLDESNAGLATALDDTDATQVVSVESDIERISRAMRHATGQTTRPPMTQQQALRPEAPEPQRAHAVYPLPRSAAAPEVARPALGAAVELFDHFWRQGFVDAARQLLVQTAALAGQEPWWQARQALLEKSQAVRPGAAENPTKDDAAHWQQALTDLKRAASQLNLSAAPETRIAQVTAALAGQDLPDGLPATLAAFGGAQLPPGPIRDHVWKLMQAVWAEGPDEQCLQFLRALALKEADPRFFGIYLDGLVATGRAALVGPAILSALTRSDRQQGLLEWARTGFERLNPAWKQLGVRGFQWNEDEGVPTLVAKLRERARPRLAAALTSS